MLTTIYKVLLFLTPKFEFSKRGFEWFGGKFKQKKVNLIQQHKTILWQVDSAQDTVGLHQSYSQTLIKWLYLDFDYVFLQSIIIYFPYLFIHLQKNFPIQLNQLF